MQEKINKEVKLKEKAQQKIDNIRKRVDVDEETLLKNAMSGEATDLTKIEKIG